MNPNVEYRLWPKTNSAGPIGTKPDIFTGRTIKSDLIVGSVWLRYAPKQPKPDNGDTR